MADWLTHVGPLGQPECGNHGGQWQRGQDDATQGLVRPGQGLGGQKEEEGGITRTERRTSGMAKEVWMRAERAGVTEECGLEC